jgi:hypothetical protein
MIVQRRSEGREVFGIQRRDAVEGERDVSPEQRERVAEMVAGLYPTHRTPA